MVIAYPVPNFADTRGPVITFGDPMANSVSQAVPTMLMFDPESMMGWEDLSSFVVVSQICPVGVMDLVLEV